MLQGDHAGGSMALLRRVLRLFRRHVFLHAPPLPCRLCQLVAMVKIMRLSTRLQPDLTQTPDIVFFEFEGMD
jgi:hypothetical protein